MEAPEMEVFTADATAAEIAHAKRHALPLGTPCANCGTGLAGPWCYACGQKGEEYHRSVLHLLAEAFEGLTHMDGRFWTTLPRLVFRPGKLTRDYLDGHRVAQIPPFRLFLVVLLVVFFLGGLSLQASHAKFRLMTPQDQEAAQILAKTRLFNTPEWRQDLKSSIASPWWRERVLHAVDNQEVFFAAMERWGHRFAILLLPIAAILLSALFAFKKGVYVFDHLIFSMHSLSFQGLLLSVVFLGGMAVSWADQALWLAPVHLFFHMRRSYRIGVIGTLVRMLFLFAGSVVAFSALLTGLVMVGLATIH